MEQKAEKLAKYLRIWKKSSTFVQIGNVFAPSKHSLSKFKRET